MPDGAFDATERQFLELVNAGSRGVELDVHRYAMDGVPRGEAVAARIADHYESVESLYDEAPDLLIVTGSNPIEVRLEDEPYWNDLVDLLNWARANVRSMMLSCLSAHAALLVYDDVARDRLAAKCTGVFAQHVALEHPLALGLEPEVLLPHSRLNAVETDRLAGAGYEVVVASEGVGWGVAAKRVGECEVMMLQGHPEYDPSSLLREYHRDARRYVQHERDDEPVLPWHCVAPEDWSALEALHHSITTDQRDVTVLESYPFDEVGARAPQPWRAAATRLYGNWLTGTE